MSQVTLQDRLYLGFAEHLENMTVGEANGYCRVATVADLVAVLTTLGATIKVVGEPGYYDHHGNDDAFIAAGSYLVWRVPTEEEK